eukprot:1485910-Prymnesium_polylepis.1
MSHTSHTCTLPSGRGSPRISTSASLIWSRRAGVSKSTSSSTIRRFGARSIALVVALICATICFATGRLRNGNLKTLAAVLMFLPYLSARHNRGLARARSFALSTCELYGASHTQTTPASRSCSASMNASATT